MKLFSEVKRSFEIITSDRFWFFKIVFAALLLINPLLLVAVISQDLKLGYWVMAINALTFWLPLGFTMEVLRRARHGTLARLGLPSWELKQWPTYLREGGIKFFISFFTLIFPSAVWIAGWVIFSGILEKPALAALAAPLIFFFTIPFCAVGCCRWLDSRDLPAAALDYRANLEHYRIRWSEYSIATLVLIGLNTVGNSLIFTLPFVTVFGLCLVDTWFGSIYADSVRMDDAPRVSLEREKVC
jgi:hypothetical protein